MAGHKLFQIWSTFTTSSKDQKDWTCNILCKNLYRNEPFAVLLGDDIVKSETPCLKQLIQIYDQCKTSVLGVQRVPGNEVSKYGIVAGEKVGERVWVNDMIESLNQSRHHPTLPFWAVHHISRNIQAPGEYETGEKRGNPTDRRIKGTNER